MVQGIHLRIRLTPTGIKWIAVRLKGKANQKQGKRVRVPGTDEFLAETGGETSILASLHVDSEPFQGVVSETAIEEEDEEKKKDPDTDFKRKESSSTDPPRKKKVVSKPVRYAQGALRIEEEEGESGAYVPSPPLPIIGLSVHEEVRVPPPTSQVAGLSVSEEARKEHAPVRGNIIFFHFSIYCRD